MRNRPGDVLIRVLAVAGMAAAVLFAGSGAQAGESGGTGRGPVPMVSAAAPAEVPEVSAAAPAEPDEAGGEQGGGDETEQILFRFTDPRITESSGLAVSPAHEDVYYTHNDSEAGPVFFAVGGDGRTRATFTVRGAAARDWEGMAASRDPRTGRGVLWFADIGDNFDGAWPDISVYKVAEPASLRDATVPAVRYRFRYEDGGHNAEGVMVHPKTGRLYVVSKEFAGSVYAAPERLRTGKVNVLRRVGSAPVMATDAAYAPDGSSFVIRTYFSATVYRDFDEQLARVPMPQLEQAESIAYTADGKALLTGSEGGDSPVHRVPLPERVLAAASPSPAPEPSGTAGTEADRPGGVPVSAVALWLLVAAGATGVIVFVARRAR
ncbi:hypothetical protein ACFOWE_21050 [Planomonospora corallina]|uniref:Uncharacterized protein n=1 Tax=Planomonospora corallina TaxID=1806052 RepID=A0ABV8I9R3_9ACTN